jgi:hypothetical protein
MKIMIRRRTRSSVEDRTDENPFLLSQEIHGVIMRRRSEHKYRATNNLRSTKVDKSARDWEEKGKHDHAGMRETFITIMQVRMGTSMKQNNIPERWAEP